MSTGSWSQVRRLPVMPFFTAALRIASSTPWSAIAIAVKAARVWFLLSKAARTYPRVFPGDQRATLANSVAIGVTLGVLLQRTTASTPGSPTPSLAARTRQPPPVKLLRFALMASASSGEFGTIWMERTPRRSCRPASSRATSAASVDRRVVRLTGTVRPRARASSCDSRNTSGPNLLTGSASGIAWRLAPGARRAPGARPVNDREDT
mmetsp:Transcript_62261/g.190199  ORF Transcript_62261/g.190199 Transcript_62261/m.190199 type:complete len:208 (+) Transcript_62261:809-1432(+)